MANRSNTSEQIYWDVTKVHCHFAIKILITQVTSVFRQYLFGADSETEVQRWTKHLSECVKQSQLDVRGGGGRRDIHKILGRRE